MKKVGVLTLFMGLLFAGCGQYGVSCPTQEQVKSSMKEFVPLDFTLEAVSPVKEVKGLCEVVIKIGAKPVILYTDSKGEYLFAGSLIRTKDKENITRSRQEELFKVDAEHLKELENYVHVRHGEGAKYIYFITDPDCPFCKRSNSIVEEWAKKNNVQIRLIFFPLPTHPEAFDKAVSILCDKKGFKEYTEGYKSKNQCEEGRKSVEKTFELVEKLGITGTPTFIGMNGRIHSGVPTEKDLDKLIN